MNNLIYKNIFAKINYNEINKVAFMYIKDFIKNKKHIKYIKNKIFNYDKENIIISNYIYLNRLQNNSSNKENIYVVYMIIKLSFYLFFQNEKEKNEDNYNINYIISKLFSELKSETKYKDINLSAFKLFCENKLDFLKQQCKMLGLCFLTISINLDSNYYNYGYNIFMLTLMNVIEYENKLLIFQEKLNIKLNINNILSKITPIFSNYIIMHNNKKFKKIKRN